jgi:hypothetical protein
MELQCQLLLYLDKRRFLCAMKDSCENYIRTLTAETVCKFPPLRFFLEFDVMDLLDVFPDLGNLLLSEPLKCKRFCDIILFSCLKSVRGEFVDTVQSSQVAVILRLRNVTQTTVNMNPRMYKSLVCFKGRLIDISTLTPYVYHTVWSCPEECEGNELILHCIPKTLPKCYICKSSLYENSGLRRCGDQITATLKCSTDMLPRTFKIVDDLIAKIKLGSQYLIHAVILKRFVEVWSMELIAPIPAPMTTVIANDIKELYDACDGLPWKFIYCLASTIGFNVCPLNCFMFLKINLLLSLTSVKANEFTGSRIIHVLVSGFDTEAVGAIMREAANLSNTSFTLGFSNTSMSTALIACSTGVCLMPLPLHSYNKKTISTVLSCIESGEVNYESGKSNLRTAIWAQGMDFKKIVLYNIASVFGTVCRGDYGEYQDEISEFLLQRAIDPNPPNREELQAMKDVAKYIDLVASIKVELDSSAEQLLRNYFLAARKEKPRGVTIGSMESLVASCLTSARLCRRQVANVEDATFAVWLHVSGNPEPRFAPDEYLQTPADIKQLHTIFNNFKNWLFEFTTTYGF